MEAAGEISLEITFGCAAFLCLLGCVWTWRGAGPCVNFLAYMALRRQMPAFAAVNLLLGAYNLLPIMPLDGGRMLLAALYLRLPEQTAWLVGRVWSLLVITCLLVLALWAAGAGRAGLLPLVMVLGSYARLALHEKSVAFCGGNRYNK